MKSCSSVYLINAFWFISCDILENEDCGDDLFTECTQRKKVEVGGWRSGSAGNGNRNELKPYVLLFHAISGQISSSPSHTYFPLSLTAHTLSLSRVRIASHRITFRRRFALDLMSPPGKGLVDPGWVEPSFASASVRSGFDLLRLPIFQQLMALQFAIVILGVF